MSTIQEPRPQLRLAMLRGLDLLEYEAVKGALQRAYRDASDADRVPISNGYQKMFARTVEGDKPERTVATPRQQDTRKCCGCGITVPAPNDPSGIPDHWRLDPREAELICDRCHKLRCAEGWQPPARYEVNQAALAAARAALRVEGA